MEAAVCGAMGGDRVEEVLKPDKSLALRADMVVYEEREDGDFGESGYQRLEHLWEETWHAPRQADRYGPGIGAGLRTTPRRSGSGGTSPDNQGRRYAQPDAGTPRAEYTTGADGPQRRQAPRHLGPMGHMRSASAGALRCDFSRLEAIWDAWWSAPSQKGHPADEPSREKANQPVPDRGAKYRDQGGPTTSPVKGPGNGEPGAGHRSGGGPEVRKPARGRPTHRRSRSWTGTEFRRVSKEWGPGWNDEDDQGFIINELNRMSFRGS